jgi:hypothetical protein
MVPAIGSRTNAKIVTARAAGLALTLASKAGPGPAPSVHPPGWRGGRACRTLAKGAVTRQAANTSSGPVGAQPVRSSLPARHPEPADGMNCGVDGTAPARLSGESGPGGPAAPSGRIPGAVDCSP